MAELRTEINGQNKRHDKRSRRQIERNEIDRWRKRESEKI